MTDKKEPWIVEFSRRLWETGPAGRPGVLREAEEALGKLRDAQVRAEIEIAERSDVDPRLTGWLHQRLESLEVRARRRTHAFFLHLRGTALATEGGAELEIGLEMIESALLQVVRRQDVDTWSQMQHNLAEALMQREAGIRADNVERAVAAFRAALSGRRGGQRVDTLVGLAQALRRRLGGERAENERDGARALAEAERLLGKRPDRERAARVLLERAMWEEEGERFEAALRTVRRAAGSAAGANLSWLVRDREAAVLTAWSRSDPGRREEALAANRALLLDERTQTTRRLAIVRSRLRALGAPLDPVTPDVLGREALLWWQDELGDASLAPELVQALELRIRREEREAFQLPSSRALVRMEAELAPLVLRLALELSHAGEERRAVAYLAHLGAWPLRRALRWVDFRSSSAVMGICQSRILEDRLAELVRLASAIDHTGWKPAPPPAGSTERLQRYLSGASDEVHLTPDELAGLWAMPPEERHSAVAELHRGMESAVEAQLRTLAAECPPLFNSVRLPPLIAAGRFGDKLSVRHALVLLQNVRAELVLGAVWRTSDGELRAAVSCARVHAAGRALELPIGDDLARLAATFRDAHVERVGVVCRGLYARLMAASLAPLTTAGTRLVHLAGVDEVSLPALDRRRSRHYLILLDPEPETALPCILAASATLEHAGFVVLRPGATLDLHTAEVLADAQGVIFAGHGEGALGPLGPAVARQPASHFDQLPLGASAWGLCMACSAGDSGRVDDLLWDHDDPAGAAEHLLLAGCRQAADCSSPVPEVLAALVLEEFAVRVIGGEEPEAVFATTIEGWRAFWSALLGPLSHDLAAGTSLEARALSAWLTERLDEERRHRLGREVAALPRDGIFRALGPRAPAARSAGAERDPVWAHEVAAGALTPFTRPETWAAFRWMVRR
jgi:hypothetical protein